MLEAKLETVFKLSNHSGSLGLSCGADGLALAGVQLLKKTDEGFASRPSAQIHRLLISAYGAEANAEFVAARLGPVANALNAGDIGLASTAAVLLRLPELDWDGAVRIAKAEDDLIKYDPDEPRDWHGRWTTGAGVGLPRVQLLSGAASEDVAEFSGQAVRGGNTNDDPQAHNPFPLPHDWVSLPPGDRIDELGDLLEWIANAKPSDAPDIAAEIDRQFTQNGDLNGAIALMGALKEVTHSDPTPADRQKILDDYEYLAKTDPREVGQKTIDNVAMLAQMGIIPSGPGESDAKLPDADTPSEAWKLGWAARGREAEKVFGANLSANFPTVDRFADGIVTSIKSIDLNAATYQDAARLSVRLNAYVTKVAEFEGGSVGEEVIASENISGRALGLVVPKGSVTAAQQVVIDAATARAKSLGVDLIVRPF